MLVYTGVRYSSASGARTRYHSARTYGCVLCSFQDSSFWFLSFCVSRARRSQLLLCISSWYGKSTPEKTTLLPLHLSHVGVVVYGGVRVGLCDCVAAKTISGGGDRFSAVHLADSTSFSMQSTITTLD